MALKKVASEKAVVWYTNSISDACGVCNVVCTQCTTHQDQHSFLLVSLSQALLACRGRRPSQVAVLPSLKGSKQLCCSCTPLRTRISPSTLPHPPSSNSTRQTSAGTSFQPRRDEILSWPWRSCDVITTMVRAGC
jgi:hypothetical protein